MPAFNSLKALKSLNWLKVKLPPKKKTTDTDMVTDMDIAIDLADQYADQYADPFADPCADPDADPYADPDADPYANPDAMITTIKYFKYFISCE